MSRAFDGVGLGLQDLKGEGPITTNQKMTTVIMTKVNLHMLVLFYFLISGFNRFLR
jgi:hypothetical protein